MTDATHEIHAHYDVIWSAGLGREHAPSYGLPVDPSLDKATHVWMGWDCSCGELGSTKDSMNQHIHMAQRAEAKTITVTTVAR